ncbi:MAG: hypothetical protein RI940_878 [Bacteroidota bacterium]|jgi:hypothetical protein
MKKSILLFLYFILTITFVKAQSPNWVCDESKFQYTMTFLGFLNIDGVVLSSTNDKIGAFVNGEVRGSANLIFEASQNRYYVYLTVFSNNENENISFKVYDATKNVVKEVIKTVPFVINNHTGSLLQAYCFSNTTLSNSAELTDVNFTNATRKTIAIVGSTVNLTLDKLQDISKLVTTFTTSPNATVFFNGQMIKSGVNSIDYYSPVSLKVRSQDETVVKDWIINLSAPFYVYRKNAVCYAKGEIKVEFPKAGESATLSLDGKIILSQPLVNSTTTFKNLNPGVYTVNVAGLSKVVTILNL